MHIFSVLDKLLQVDIKHVIASNNNNEQIKNFQGENRDKFQPKIKPSNNGSSKGYKKPGVQQNYKSTGNKQISDPNTCYVCFAKDGDTFVAMHNGEKKTFRLAGIDAPELGHKWAEEATLFLKDLIGKKRVYLTFRGEDKFKRSIVDVYLDEFRSQHVNKLLIEAGLASSERYKNNEGEHTHDILEYANNEIAEGISKFRDKGIWNNDSNSLTNNSSTSKQKRSTP